MKNLCFYQSEGFERISSPPGHVISQGLAPRARVVTRGGGGGGGSGGGVGGGSGDAGSGAVGSAAVGRSGGATSPAAPSAEWWSTSRDHAAEWRRGPMSGAAVAQAHEPASGGSGAACRRCIPRRLQPGRRPLSGGPMSSAAALRARVESDSRGGVS